MLNLHTGKKICVIKGGKYNKKYIYLDENYTIGADEIELTDGEIEPLLNTQNERAIWYIAGPSGSGKSTQVANLVKTFIKDKKNTNLYMFSRTDYKNDPAYKGLNIYQIEINNDLLDSKMDIEKEIKPNSVIIFDDVNTIQDNILRKYIEDLMCDIMEIGRKLKINCIITNHLIIPNERKYARCLLNEIQYLSIFPKSGSIQQISYVLKMYFGLTSKQIKNICNIDSRCVTICKLYPNYVLYNKGIFIL